jgi:hypothetical protein
LLRGFGGRGGRRSIMTDRGGTGMAAKRRMTTKENETIDLVIEISSLFNLFG